jgi:hypothetical protein
MKYGKKYTSALIEVLKIPEEVPINRTSAGG